MIDRFDKCVGGHAHQARQFFQCIGFQRIFARRRADPDFLRPIAGRRRRPHLVNRARSIAVGDVPVDCARLVLHRQCQMIVRFIFRRKPLAQLVDTQIRHQLRRIKHQRMRIFVLNRADRLAHLMTVAGVGRCAVHPVIQSQIARAAAFLQLGWVEFITAGRQNDTLGAQIFHVAFRRLGDHADDFSIFFNQLTGRSLHQHFCAGLLDLAC